ncbi:MAG: pyridoxamine 5'-phosphate oxidase family protein [Deltaproteobacteria bacterium]|nr:pyridoxamine 5'-phosphate oxidase family protein [Deltaproteobacteria bacterium]
MGRFHELAFTPAVQALQTKLGSRRAYQRVQDDSGASDGPDRLGPDERAFIATRDSFYLASVGAGGWPYVQHRGGPPGFLRVLDEHTLGFADFRGNRQYISVGNLAGDDRVALIMVDYPHQVRLKLLAHARVTEDPALLGRLAVPGYDARVERGVILAVEGLDWNCPQHITPRYTLDEARAILAKQRP